MILPRHAGQIIRDSLDREDAALFNMQGCCLALGCFAPVRRRPSLSAARPARPEMQRGRLPVHATRKRGPLARDQETWNPVFL